MQPNQSLNNTCILFDPKDEAQQKAIIRFYNDNGFEGTPTLEWWSNDCIGIFQGITGPELDYWDNDGSMKVIDLPKEYYPIDTPIVEQLENISKYNLDGIGKIESKNIINHQFMQGYVCAVCALINMDGVNTYCKELFRMGVGNYTINQLREMFVDEGDLQTLEQYWNDLH